MLHWEPISIRPIFQGLIRPMETIPFLFPHLQTHERPQLKTSVNAQHLLQSLRAPLKTIWERSELLEKLKRKENLKGKCGRCEMKDCRGCRSLALALTGDYLAEDPHCWYHDI